MAKNESGWEPEKQQQINELLDNASQELERAIDRVHEAKRHVEMHLEKGRLRHHG